MRHPHFKSRHTRHTFTHIEAKERRTGSKMNVIRNYRNWRRYRETVSELKRLSNRDLSDIGMKREDIRQIARDAI